MIEFKFKKSDMDSLLKALDSSNAKKDIAKILRDGINKALSYVRKRIAKNHRYQDRTGNLTRSVHFYTDRSGLFGKIGLSGFTNDRILDSKFTAKSSKSGFKYGRKIHQGHGTWQPDQFVFYNFDNSKNVIMDYLTQSYSKVIQKIGGK